MQTREDIIIEVATAFKNGKTVQVTFKGQNNWSDIYNPSWDWYLKEYRIKPEDVYVNCYRKKIESCIMYGIPYKVESDAIKHIDRSSDYIRTIHFREVP